MLKMELMFARSCERRLKRANGIDVDSGSIGVKNRNVEVNATFEKFGPVRRDKAEATGEAAFFRSRKEEARGKSEGDPQGEPRHAQVREGASDMEEPIGNVGGLANGKDDDTHRFDD